MSLLLLVPSHLESARMALPDRPGVEVMNCGVGLLAAGLSTTRRLLAGGVDRCVLVGLAGTRDRHRVPLGTLVAGTAVRDQAFGAGHGRTFLGLHEMNLPDGDALPSLLPLDDPGIAGAFPCVLGSVASASDSLSQGVTWRRRHPDALVEEMEGYAVALACRHAGVPVSVVRAISNVAGDRDLSNWQLTPAFDALNRALVALMGPPSPR